MFKQIRANRYIKMIRPGDIIVVIGLFILSFAPVAVFSWHEWQTTQAADSNAQVLTTYVKHDGKTVYKVNLTTHHGVSHFTYRDAGGDYNKIKVTDHAIEVTEANCFNQIDVKRGKISKPGQTIVCLPHKLLIEIKAKDGTDTGGMVSAWFKRSTAMTNNQTRKYIYIALLCAQGIIIGLVERAIPFPFAVAPGAKLGLANLITIISLFTLPINDCFLLMVMRTVLSALLGGTLSTFMYSIAGATLSFFGMILLKQFSRRFMSTIGISAAGGLLFNVGQLCVASFIAQSWQVLLYLPVLAFLGILAGIAVGVAANFLFEHVKTLTFLKAQHEI